MSVESRGQRGWSSLESEDRLEALLAGSVVLLVSLGHVKLLQIYKLTPPPLTCLLTVSEVSSQHRLPGLTARCCGAVSLPEAPGELLPALFSFYRLPTAHCLWPLPALMSPASASLATSLTSCLHHSFTGTLVVSRSPPGQSRAPPTSRSVSLHR